MKYNVDYHKQISKSVDSQSLLQWRNQYLNGMTAQAWCKRAQQLNQDWSNPKVIRNFGFKNNSD